MRIRWSPDAAADLERIHEQISKKSLDAANHVVRTIYDRCKTLKTFPNGGRVGREPGSRELVFAPLPYIAVYRVRGSIIEISRIWHGAQERS